MPAVRNREASFAGEGGGKPPALLREIQKGLDGETAEWYRMYHDIPYRISRSRSSSPDRP
jgi:hypothetical protein